VKRTMSLVSATVFIIWPGDETWLIFGARYSSCLLYHCSAEPGSITCLTDDTVSNAFFMIGAQNGISVVDVRYLNRLQTTTYPKQCLMQNGEKLRGVLLQAKLLHLVKELVIVALFLNSWLYALRSVSSNDFVRSIAYRPSASVLWWS